MADIEITSKPPVPDELKAAAESNKLVLFVGAGLSMLGGSPSWDDFANVMLNSLVKNEKLTYSDLEQIKGLPPRTKITMACSLGDGKPSRESCKNILQPKKDEICAKVCSKLFEMANIVITTNYDEWIDDAMLCPKLTVESEGSQPSERVPAEVFYKKSDLLINKLESNKKIICHLHGSIKDPSSMILTLPDYFNHYRSCLINGEEHNEVLVFLMELFKEKTLLFIGYSLEELEILEYVFLKSSTESGSKHYILQGFFEHQTKLVTLLKSHYYNKFGVNLLPFSRDRYDWHQLIEVLEFFSSELKAGITRGIEIRSKMEELIT